MARVELIDEESAPELAPAIARIKQRRRGTLINVYRLLLRSPALAESWFAHNNAVRWDTDLAARLRELVIVRIAWLTGAAYVLNQHVPKLAAADGVSEAECRLLMVDQPRGFAPQETAALAYADSMTRDITVPDAVFAPLRDHFSEKQIVELTVLIGTYNMQGRVLQALELDLQSDPPEAEW